VKTFVILYCSRNNKYGQLINALVKQFANVIGGVKFENFTMTICTTGAYDYQICRNEKEKGANGT
jgi:hypothetical protein